ncbi:hypothetical protein [Flavobacterium sp.]
MKLFIHKQSLFKILLLLKSLNAASIVVECDGSGNQGAVEDWLV